MNIDYCFTGENLVKKKSIFKVGDIVQYVKSLTFEYEDLNSSSRTHEREGR